MKVSPPSMFTPVYLKTDDFEWPKDEKVFNLVTKDGMFICRNTKFFTSAVPTKRFPSELEGQKALFKSRYPIIPAALIELAVGFFSEIEQEHHSEAGALFVWNETTQAVELLIPEQAGIVGTSNYGGKTHSYAMDLEYTVPTLPPHLVQIGDFHSHADMSAYSSFTDQYDEKHRPGIHLVVGLIHNEPPQFHCEIVADSYRFKVDDLSGVMEKYTKRNVASVPKEWYAKFQVKPYKLKKWKSNTDSFLDDRDAIWHTCGPSSATVEGSAHQSKKSRKRHRVFGGNE